MPFGATPSRWCVCHFTTSAECAKTHYTIRPATFADALGRGNSLLSVRCFRGYIAVNGG